MSAINVGDKLEVKFYCWSALIGQLGLNVRHILVSDALGTPTTQPLAESISAVFAPVYRSLLSFYANFIAVSVRNMAIPTDAPAFGQSGSGVGDVAGDMLPGQVAGIISLKTDFTGRNNRGRVYVPFPGEVDNGQGQQPVGSYVDRLVVLGTWFQAQASYTAGVASSIDGRWVIHQRLTNGSVIITSHIARQRWGTQRRRGAYGARNPNPLG